MSPHCFTNTTYRASTPRPNRRRWKPFGTWSLHVVVLPTVSWLTQSTPLKNPPALTLDDLMVAAPGLEWLRDQAKRKFASYRLSDCQYIAVRNPDAKDKLWKINGRRQIIYARQDLTPEQRTDAAVELLDKLNTKQPKT